MGASTPPGTTPEGPWPVEPTPAEPTPAEPTAATSAPSAPMQSEPVRSEPPRRPPPPAPPLSRASSPGARRVVVLAVLALLSRRSPAASFTLPGGVQVQRRAPFQ